MKKRVFKGFLVLLMLVGIVFSIMNFVAPDVSAYTQWGHDIYDPQGNAYDCDLGGHQCAIVTPYPPKD
jgi:hypothetical protein